MAKAKTPRANGAANSKRVIQMPEPSATTLAVSETRKTTAPLSIDLQGEIRRRAYELYEQRGCAPGFEQQDWAQAERNSRNQESTAERINHDRLTNMFPLE